ncbi:MAG: ParA family protein [Lachnospiraceae bacterium]|nr:ParA family protein [Lachnospiraceae bacterium]
MKIVTIANQKGGTAKSTTAAALTQAAVKRKQRVLAIDMDPQGNLSFFLGADTNRSGSYELLTGENPKQTMQEVQGGTVISASCDLPTLKTEPGSARRLQKALSKLENDFDICIIDTPPTAGEMQYNALQAADSLLIPVHADIVGLQGLYQIVDTARQIQQSNKKLKIMGYILTEYSGRSIIERQMEETIEAKASEMHIPFLQSIRKAVAVREAQTLQKSLYEYAPKSNPAIDYMELFKKIIKNSD